MPTLALKYPAQQRLSSEMSLVPIRARTWGPRLETLKLFNIPTGGKVSPKSPLVEERLDRSTDKHTAVTLFAVPLLWLLPNPSSLPPVEQHQHLLVTLQTVGSRLQAGVMQEGIYIDLTHA